MRNTFDLGHLNYCVGKVGRLQTLDCIPVYAGDSLAYGITAGVSLSPLRQQLALDPRIDLFAFYRPHRHQYGSSWTEFLEDGLDENVTFPSDGGGDSTQMEFLGIRFPLSEVPTWAFGGYNTIWNRYFKDPGSSDRTGILATIGEEDRKYGFTTCHLNAYWNLGLPDLDAGVPEEREVSSSGATIDVLDLDKARTQYGSKVARAWFNARETYNDLMQAIWNTSVSTDADERPTILGRKSVWMNGMVVSGIDEVGRAATTGATRTVIKFGFPKRFFKEHGAVWIMMLLRYPPVIYNETNRKALMAQLSYKDNAAEGRLLEFDPPRDAYFNEFWVSGDQSNPARVLPDNFHYRYHPNRVHNDYAKLEGFPILDNKARIGPYINSSDYDKIFSTTPLGHWHLQGKVSSAVSRQVPADRKSIFTGAR